LACATASAHHSVSGQFDPDVNIQAKGVLKKVEWINPHPYLTFDVTMPDGKAQEMAMETAAPAALRRAGLEGKKALQVGATYTLFFHPARNKNPGIGLLNAFTLPDGRIIGASSGKSLEAARQSSAGKKE
jgi:hypothetical protein